MNNREHTCAEVHTQQHAHLTISIIRPALRYQVGMLACDNITPNAADITLLDGIDDDERGAILSYLTERGEERATEQWRAAVRAGLKTITARETTCCLVCGKDIADCPYGGKHPRGEVVMQPDGSYRASSQTSADVYTQRVNFGFVTCDCPARKNCWHIDAVTAAMTGYEPTAFDADMGYLSIYQEIGNRAKHKIEPTADDANELRAFSRATLSATLSQMEMSGMNNLSAVHHLWYGVLSNVFCDVAIF